MAKQQVVVIDSPRPLQTGGVMSDILAEVWVAEFPEALDGPDLDDALCFGKWKDTGETLTVPVHRWVPDEDDNDDDDWQRC